LSLNAVPQVFLEGEATLDRHYLLARRRLSCLLKTGDDLLQLSCYNRRIKYSEYLQESLANANVKRATAVHV